LLTTIVVKLVSLKFSQLEILSELVRFKRMTYQQGRNERGKAGAIPRAPSHYRGAKSLRAASKSPNNVTSTFFDTIHFLPKNLNFEHVGAKLASCPGRHLISLRPCLPVTKRQ